MRRIILFSEPNPRVKEELKDKIFADFLDKKILAYLPSDGAAAEANVKYTPLWQQYAESNQADFVFIDNSQRGDLAKVEAQKLLSANILIITGGNTFILLNHLRQSGLDQAIIQFFQKSDVTIAGFSAGGMVLGPTIRLAVGYDKDDIGLKNLAGLSITDVEILPHYDPTNTWMQDTYQTYLAQNGKPPTTLTNEQYIIIDK